MTSEEFAQVREIFHRCCDLPQDQRKAVLDAACESNAHVRVMVEELLLAETQQALPIEAGGEQLAKQLLASDVESHAGVMPAQIGPYKIIRVLGEGGMGIAYLAEQSNPSRRVALKVLRAGAFSASMRSRFAREVRMLGRLSHPGIARIFEAGTTEASREQLSYFAMEYVSGSRITTFVNDNSLSMSARLELIARVADAVQHAHSNGIIHRDLKPANILVKGAAIDSKRGGTADTGETNGPTPVILDFGVARMLNDDSGHEQDNACTALTEAGSVIGTIGYMSPEQLAGSPSAIDARADVYSLSVLLYELLTGRLPFDLQGKPIAEAARIIRDEEPASLESREQSEIQGVQLDRDIRTIVHRAMARDRERRYATAAAFAEDIRRYLTNQPILARPATLSYQLAKFAKRHRSLVAGSLIALLALMVGLAVSITLYFREEQQRKRADEREQRAVSLQRFMVENLLKAPAPDRLGQDATMVDALLAAREGLDARFANQPALEVDVRTSLADVLRTIGKVEESTQEWDTIVAMLERTRGPHDEQTISAMIEQASTNTLAQHHRKGADIAAEALSRARELQPQHPELLIHALTQVGRGEENRNYFGAARKAYREALDVALKHPASSVGKIMAIRCSIMACEQGMRHPEAALELNALVTKQLKDATLTDEERTRVLAALITNNLANNRVDDAVTLADELGPVVDRAFSMSRRGFFYRTMVRAYIHKGRFEDAERYALQTHASFAKLYPKLSTQNEWATGMLIDLYSAWPGHEACVVEWATQSAAYRLMLSAQEDDNINGATKATSRKITLLQRALSDTGAPATTADALNLLWERRNELAPVRHARRAWFFANFALISKTFEHRLHFDEALLAAEEALPDAIRPERVRDLIQAAKRR